MAGIMLSSVSSPLLSQPIRLNGAEFYPPGVQLSPQNAARPVKNVQAELLPRTPQGADFVTQQIAGQSNNKHSLEPAAEAAASYQAAENVGTTSYQLDIFA